jgi:hypothetical protein
MTADRDELAALIFAGLDEYGTDMTAIAESILARWRLVPVEEDYQVAWLTFRNPDGSMRYTTVASGHGDGDWIVNGEVATGYAEVQEIPVGQQHRAADEPTHHDQDAGHYSD